MKRLFIALLITISTLEIAVTQETAGTAGSEESVKKELALVKQIKGIATVYRKDENEWVQISAGDVLVEGDQISISDNSSITMDIENKTVTLTGSTLIVLENMTSEMLLKLY